MRLSVVTTMYGSAEFVEEFYRRSSAAVAAFTEDFEIILVNDGSPDQSLAIALALVEHDPRVRVVDLSRNFGHHPAIMAGLAFARGELIFLVDSDLEEDPSLLPAFLSEMDRTGADVVFGVQVQRKGGAFERIAGAAFYKLFNALSEQPIPSNLATIRLMTRRYVEALLRHEERELFLGGVWASTGFDQRALAITKGYRAGTSYTIRKRSALFVNAVTSFTSRPLTMVFWLGALISTASFLAALTLIARKIFFGGLLIGWASLIVSVWMLGGLTIFCLGIIGIYLGKIFSEVKHRPSSIVRRVHERLPSAQLPSNRTNMVNSQSP